MQVFSRIPLAVVLLTSISPALRAQQIVHAAEGVLKGIDTSAHSITVVASDGSEVTYRDETKGHPDLAFDKKLRGQAVDVSSFNKNGDQVVVYYFGAGASPTAVAVKDLGAQPLTAVSGNVTKPGRHALTLTTDAGATQTFQIAPTATVEASEGAVEGKDFSAKKGEHISVAYPTGDNTRTAVFVTAD